MRRSVLPCRAAAAAVELPHPQVHRLGVRLPVVVAPGEVGLIFAGIGASLMIQGHPVVSPETCAAAVFMVVVTTTATPPLPLWSLNRDGAAAPL